MRVALGLFLVTAAVFWNVSRCDFVSYDDDLYVTGNAMVRQGLTWKGIAWAFDWRDCVYWHPVGWISHMLDVELFGMNPRGHHIINLLLHAANAVLLFALLRRMTGALWRSAIVAALFALHPLRVESVAWVTERKDVLSGFFGLLSLICYSRYAEAKGRGASSAISYLLALLCFALGLMSKAMLMTLPVLLLLLDHWPLNRLQGQPLAPVIRRLLWEKIPFILLSAVAVTITILQHRQAGTLASFSQAPLLTRLGSAPVAYAMYVADLFRPVNLALPYLYPEPWAGWIISLSIGFLLTMTTAAFGLAKSRPWLVVGWLWFLIMLAPVIGIIRLGHDYIADRFTYLPSIGLIVPLVWFCGDLVARGRVPEKVMRAAAALALLACAVLTVRQTAHWRTTETLFRHTLAVRPGNPLALSNLSAFLLAKDGATPEAVDLLRQSLKRNRNSPTEWNNYGGVMMMQKRYPDAIAAYENAILLAPGQFEAHANLGRALILTGQTSRGLAELTEALRHPADDSRNLDDVRDLINQVRRADRTGGQK